MPHHTTTMALLHAPTGRCRATQDSTHDERRPHAHKHGIRQALSKVTRFASNRPLRPRRRRRRPTPRRCPTTSLQGVLHLDAAGSFVAFLAPAFLNSCTWANSVACAWYFSARSPALREPAPPLPNQLPGISTTTLSRTCSSPGYCLMSSKPAARTLGVSFVGGIAQVVSRKGHAQDTTPPCVRIRSK